MLYSNFEGPRSEYAFRAAIPIGMRGLIRAFVVPIFDMGSFPILCNIQEFISFSALFFCFKLVRRDNVIYVSGQFVVHRGNVGG